MKLLFSSLSRQLQWTISPLFTLNRILVPFLPTSQFVTEELAPYFVFDTSSKQCRILLASVDTDGSTLNCRIHELCVALLALIPVAFFSISKLVFYLKSCQESRIHEQSTLVQAWIRRLKVELGRFQLEKDIFPPVNPSNSLIRIIQEILLGFDQNLLQYDSQNQVETIMEDTLLHIFSKNSPNLVRELMKTIDNICWKVQFFCSLMKTMFPQTSLLEQFNDLKIHFPPKLTFDHWELKFHGNVNQDNRVMLVYSQLFEKSLVEEYLITGKEEIRELRNLIVQSTLTVLDIVYVYEAAKERNMNNLRERFLECFPNGLEILQTHYKALYQEVAKICDTPDIETSQQLISKWKTNYYYILSMQIAKKVSSILRSIPHSLKTPVVLCMGPSGVGKTEFAKVVAQSAFEGRLIRLDMNNYIAETAITTLLGVDPGYVGNNTPGKLVEEYYRVILNQKDEKKRDYNEKNILPTVILLDEFEKAHVKLQTFFLTMFDEGYFCAKDPYRKIINHQQVVNPTSITTDNAGYHVPKSASRVGNVNAKAPAAAMKVPLAVAKEEKFQLDNCFIVVTSNVYKKEIAQFFYGEENKVKKRSNICDDSTSDNLITKPQVCGYDDVIDFVERLNNEVQALPSELLGRTTILPFGQYTISEYGEILQAILFRSFHRFKELYEKLVDVRSEQEELWIDYMLPNFFSEQALNNSNAGAMGLVGVKHDVQLRKIERYVQESILLKLSEYCKSNRQHIQKKLITLKFHYAETNENPHTSQQSPILQCRFEVRDVILEEEIVLDQSTWWPLSCHL